MTVINVYVNFETVFDIEGHNENARGHQSTVPGRPVARQFQALTVAVSRRDGHTAGRHQIKCAFVPIRNVFKFESLSWTPRLR